MEKQSESVFAPEIHHTAVIEGNVTAPITTHIEAYCVLALGHDAELILGERNTFYPNVTIRSKCGVIRLGNDVSLGPGVIIYEARAGLEIGDNCMLAAGTRICGTSHGSRLGEPMRFQKTTAEHIKIGQDVWIGMNTIIHPGVEIGEGTIIGSGSIVTKSIPSYCVAMGAPCKVTRRR